MMARHETEYAQTVKASPLTPCPGQYHTNNLTVPDANGSLHWTWQYYAGPFNGGCGESGVQLNISPASGNTGSVDYVYDTDLAQNGSIFDYSRNNYNACVHINTNPVFNQFNGTMVNVANGTPYTYLEIHSNSGCSMNDYYESIYWQ